MADGPATFGTPVRSDRPGVYIVELPAPVSAAPIDFNAVGRWIERVPTLTVDGATGRPGGTWPPVSMGSGCPTRPSSTSGMSGASIGTRVGAFRPDPVGRPPAVRRWLLAQDPGRPRQAARLVGRDATRHGRVRGRAVRGVRRGRSRRDSPPGCTTPTSSSRSPTSRPPTRSASATASPARCWPTTTDRPASAADRRAAAAAAQCRGRQRRAGSCARRPRSARAARRPPAVGADRRRAIRHRRRTRRGGRPGRPGARRRRHRPACRRPGSRRSGPSSRS